MKVVKQVDASSVERLSAAAWDARKFAHAERTKVGAAILCDDGKIHAACNVENRFKTPCVHAEVAAVCAMVASGGSRTIVAILIAAERERFTPCGSCRDVLTEFSVQGTTVLTQSTRGSRVTMYHLEALTPYYPI